MYRENFFLERVVGTFLNKDVSSISCKNNLIFVIGKKSFSNLRCMFIDNISREICSIPRNCGTKHVQRAFRAVVIALPTFLLYIAKRMDKMECDRPVRNFTKNNAIHFRGERFSVFFL